MNNTDNIKKNQKAFAIGFSVTLGAIAIIFLLISASVKPYEKVWGKTYVAHGKDQIATVCFASYGLAENLGNKCVTFTIGDINTGFIEHGRTSYTIVNNNTLFIPDNNATFTIEGNGERIVTGGTVYTRQ